ncbi:DUF305 domain-containing protein [Nonomuraea sp. NPDC048916]|uniref:DUF305 domain-containing protein n=1 Tax=Nonomuraea sp. NPDC048916 TaxID=3154232 RepID=UPI00340D061D
MRWSARRLPEILWTVVAVALCVPVLAACAPAGGEPVAAAGVAAEVNPDVQFSQEMIPHHRQTIRIAELVADRTTNAYVRKLGEKLIIDERADIELMESWLRSWQAQVPPEDADYGHAMPGMISAAQISVLEGQSGAEFDRTWLTLLARHLDSGVEMAQAVQTMGTHKPTADLAGKLITEQKATIAEIVKRLA